MEYRELKAGIRDHLNNAAEDFFVVGYFLRRISEDALFAEDGYDSVWEFAKGEYGLSASSASRFMAINARFSVDGGEHMAEKYVGMGVSKLQEMLGLPDEELERVTRETTVREIRAMKAAKRERGQLSFYGVPRTVRPEGSLLATPGCGDGGHACFDCARPCGIRQEERHCMTATMGNPFPCTQMGEEKRLAIGAGLFSEECQHLHPELAPVREGDQEPEPCCLGCAYKTCASRCDVARRGDEDGRGREREKLQREAEARRSEPSQGDIKAFCDWAGIKAADNVTADGLKGRYKNSGGGGPRGTGLRDYAGSARGMRINHKREITWAQLARRIKEVQEAEALEAAFAKRSEDARKKVHDLIRRQEEERRAEAEKAEGETGTRELREGRELEIIDVDFKEAREPETADDPEDYTLADVRERLRKCEEDLKAYREVGGMPDRVMRKQKMLVDALRLLAEKKAFDEMEEERWNGA